MVAYNLMRALIAWGAEQLKIPPRQISFSRAAALTRIFGNKLRTAASKEQRNDLARRYLLALKQSQLPVRKNVRIEPRKIVRQKNRYPVMRKTRDEERQLASEALKEHGHRGSLVSRLIK
jgi:hypothetical protein